MLILKREFNILKTRQPVQWCEFKLIQQWINEIIYVWTYFENYLMNYINLQASQCGINPFLFKRWHFELKQSTNGWLKVLAKKKEQCKFEIDQIMLPHQKMFESFVNFTNINGESLIKKIYIKCLKMVCWPLLIHVRCATYLFSLLKINLDSISKAFGTVYSNHKK